MDSILSGKASQDIKDRVKSAKFDERLSLLGLILDAATGELRAVMQQDELMTGYMGSLKQFRMVISNAKTNPVDALTKVIDGSQKTLDSGKKAGSLSQDQQKTSMQIINLLKDQLRPVSKAKDGKAAFDIVKKDFDARVKNMKRQADDAGKKLQNVFTFFEDIFEDGQEMLILVTELTINPHSARFISRYGCDKYFAHNKELLFYERQREIIREIEELELED